ncbi:unnamed protein product, partial [Hapterophycus canaliculatus]
GGKECRRSIAKETPPCAAPRFASCLRVPGCCKTCQSNPRLCVVAFPSRANSTHLYFVAVFPCRSGVWCAFACRGVAGVGGCGWGRETKGRLPGGAVQGSVVYGTVIITI